MKVICLALLAVGSRSVGVGDVSTVVAAFQGELTAVKESHQELNRNCDVETRNYNKAIRGYAAEAKKQQETAAKEAASQAAFESKRDKLSDDLDATKALYAREAEGPAYDPAKCTAEQEEYQGLLDAVTSALDSIAAKKGEITGLLLTQLEDLSEMVGKENMNSCMAAEGGEADQSKCDAFDNGEECRANGCHWAVVYNYKSGGVTRALQNLFHQFEDEKHEHAKQCENNKNAHNLMESAKAGARENFETQMAQLEAAIEAADQDAQTAQGASETATGLSATATSDKEAEQTNLDQLTAHCENESKTLGEQQTAIEEVIPMLEALEENKHSLTHPGSFLQIGHFVRRLSPAQRVQEHLQRFADKHPKSNFASITATLGEAIQMSTKGVKKGVFTKVIGMIHTMTDRMHSQIREQNKAYEHCKQEFTSNFAEFADTDKKMAELNGDISALRTNMNTREDAMADTKQAITDAQNAITASNDEHRDTQKTAKLMEKDAIKCMETCDSAVRIVKHKFSTTGSDDADKGGRLDTLLGAVDGLRAKCEGSRDEAVSTQNSSATEHDQFVHDKQNEVKNGNRLLSEQTTTQGQKQESHTTKKKALALLARKRKGLDRFWFTLQKQCLPDEMQSEDRPADPATVWPDVEAAYNERRTAIETEIQALDEAAATLEDANV